MPTKPDVLKALLADFNLRTAETYSNFTGPRYVMWAISGSDLGQISPNIWTAP